MTNSVELTDRLHSVGNSYEHFVNSTLHLAEQYGIGDELMAYMHDHPDATSSDVIKERCRLIHGVII